jgi:large subunit ribosomal protein L3
MSVDMLIGRKVGMTSVFDDSGSMLGVTVLEITPNRVLGRRTADKDGYDALTLGYGLRRASRSRKPIVGQVRAAGLEQAPEVIREVHCDSGADVAIGSDVSLADVFEAGQYVDVVGTSRGMGFQGVRKRHHFSYGPASHGSKNYREPGSTGQCTTPGRVFKGKRMAGHMGNKRRTIRNLRVVKVDAENNLLLVAGPVAGADSNVVLVRKAIAKRIAKAN